MALRRENIHGVQKGKRLPARFFIPDTTPSLPPPHDMTPTLPFLNERFSHFNAVIFNSQLPPVPIELSRATSFQGACTYRRKRGLLGRMQKYDFRIRISTAMEMSEAELEDVLIHEMIHYYIGVKGIKDSSTHGNVFRSMADDINRRYGRHITVSHRLSREELVKMKGDKPRDRVVALVTMADGRRGIKVLPMRDDRVAFYCHNVSRSDKVRDIRLFKTNHPFFNRYPCSSALNVSFTDAEEAAGILLSGNTDE